MAYLGLTSERVSIKKVASILDANGKLLATGLL